MTLLETFDDICTSKLSPAVTILYGEMDADEGSIKRMIDAIKKSKFPLMVILPYVVTDVKAKSGYIKSKIPFNAFLLNHLPDQKTIDFTHKDAELKVIEPMRILAREFINFFNVSEIIDAETFGVEDVKYTPTFAKGDSVLFGVEISCVMPFHETTNTVCTT